MLNSVGLLLLFITLAPVTAIVNITCGQGTVLDPVTSQCTLPSSASSIRQPTILTNASIVHLYGNDVAFHDLANAAQAYPTYKDIVSTLAQTVIATAQLQVS